MKSRPVTLETGVGARARTGTPGFVTCERGETLLVVPVEAGVAELGRARALSGRARALFEEGAWRAAEELEARLAALGAPPERARADAERLSDALEGRAEGEPGFTASAADLEALARAVLGAGERLRFQARGRSMRPFLPHGSLLEVGARAFETIERGEVVLYASEEGRLVAHRVLARDAGGLVARGDSSARLDRVPEGRVLGVVLAARAPGAARPVDVSRGPRRALGLALGWLHARVTEAARALVIGPLRRSYGGRSPLRGLLRGVTRVACGVLVRLERLARRMRSPFEELHAALASSAEKDDQRRALYGERGVQGFTSLDENVAAGLTLLEEVLLARHSVAPCRALVLGCGPGRECFALAERGFEVTGLDREPAMLETARALAARRGLAVRLVPGEAHDFRVEGAPFGLVVVFSGLYDMLLPRARRVALLRCARAHLAPGGRLALTFLSAYVPPGVPPPPRVRTFLEALSPEHEDGDRFLLNESVHVFPRASDVEDEAREAGFAVEALFRDQRAYDRFEGRVKGYALFCAPG